MFKFKYLFVAKLTEPTVTHLSLGVIFVIQTVVEEKLVSILVSLQLGLFFSFVRAMTRFYKPVSSRSDFQSEEPDFSTF